jgi:CRISPR-associated endonuclease/helicase Cas3
MSATLGSFTRERLEAAAQGRPGDTPSFESACSTPYPIVHHSPRGELTARHSVDVPGLAKVMKVDVAAIADDVAAIVALALAAARAGARVLVLRNTVRDAVATQEALESIIAEEDQTVVFRVGSVLTLHHARFAREDRAELDRAIEARFGKAALAHGGCVAIATQTVQQSLDLDSDLLLTDLAPMDVLLQRLGRLHRHRERDPDRPAGFQTPRAIVLVGEDALETHLRARGEPCGPHGIGTVYEDLVVLEATRRQLVLHSVLRIPEDNRELVEAATHPEALDALASSLGEPWPSHRAQVMGKHFSHRGLAVLNRSKVPWAAEYVN